MGVRRPSKKKGTILSIVIILALAVLLPLTLAATDGTVDVTSLGDMDDLLDGAKSSSGSEEDFDALIADLDKLVDKGTDVTGADKAALDDSVLGDMKELLDRAKSSEGSEEDYDALLADFDKLVAKGTDATGVDGDAVNDELIGELKGLLDGARESDGSEKDFDASLDDIDGLAAKGTKAIGVDEADVEATVERKIEQVEGRMSQVADPRLQEEIEALLERARKSHGSGDNLNALLEIEDAITLQDAAIWGTGTERPSTNPLERWMGGLNELDRIYFLGVAIALFLTVAAFVFAHGPGEEVVAAPVRYVFRIKRLGIISLGIVCAVVLGVIGILPAVVYGLIGGILGTAFNAPAVVADLGVTGIVAFPLGFAIMGLIGGVLGAVLFDIVAFVTGGIGLELESGRLKRVGLISFGKLYGGILCLLGIAPGPVRMMLPLMARQMPFTLVALPVGGVVVGFLCGIIEAFAYNLLAKLNGGIALELKGGALRHVGVFSSGSFCAIPLLLVGIVPAALYGPVGTIIGPLVDFGEASGSMGLSAIAIFPFGFAVGGFLIGGLGALLCNLAFRFSGGLALGLDAPSGATPVPASKPVQKQPHELKSSKRAMPPKGSKATGRSRPHPRGGVGLMAKSRRTGNMPVPAVNDPASFSGSVLMVVRPQEPLSPNEVKSIAFNVESGMGLLLVGDGGEDNSNLNGLARRFGASFNSDTVSSFEGSDTAPYTPHMYALPHVITEGLEGFQVDRCCSLRLADWYGQVLLFSSEHSFSDVDGSGTQDEDEYAGTCAVMGKAEIGNGRVVFIGDAVMFERNSPADVKLLDRVFKWLKHET